MTADPLEIVYVDPKTDFLELIEVSLFRYEPFHLKHFKRTDVALDYIIEHKPSLVLTRRWLSPYNGVELIKCIKSVSEKTIPIIMLSVAGSEKEIQEAWEAGADYYIVLPFEPGMLSEAVEKVLATYAKRI